jgi:hypothetical protein
MTAAKSRKLPFARVRRISVIATHAFTQLVRMKVFYFLGFFAVIGIASNFFNLPQQSGPEALGDNGMDLLRLIKSWSLGPMTLFSVVMGIGTWRRFRSHPKTKARCTGVQVAGISLQQAQGLFMLPVNLVVGALSYETAKVGQSSKPKAQVRADDVFLLYAVPSPTPMDPSAFKCFTTGNGNVEAVRTYRDESARSDVHAVDWSEDLEVTSSQAVRRLAIS